MGAVADFKSRRRLNGTQAFVDVKLNGTGVKKMRDSYEALVLDSSYDDQMKELYPVAEEVAGTVATSVFTRTTGTWVVDELVGKKAIFYTKTSFDTATGKDLATYSLDIQEITDNDTTTITVGADITAGVTAVIVLDSEWHIVEGRQSQDTSKSISLINVNSSDNNGIVANITGNKDKSINCTVIFSPDAAMLKQLEYASEYGCPVTVRAGDVRSIGATIQIGDYVISDFSASADTTGEGIITKTCNFSPSANFDFRDQVAADQVYLGLQQLTGSC